MKRTKILSCILSAAMVFSSMAGLLGKSPVSPLAEASITAEAADLVWYRTTGTYVNVRSGPTTQASVVRTIATKYTAVTSWESPKNGWLKLSDGNYISAKYVERITPYAYTTQVRYTTGTYVNVRTGPGTNYPVAFSIPAKGTGVCINSMASPKNGFTQMTTGLWISSSYIR